MKIKIYEDRSYSRDNFSNDGTEYENLATTLYFEFPEKVNGVTTSSLNKYIVFDINGERTTDILSSNNSYTIPAAITQQGIVNFNIYLIAHTDNGEDSPFRWISKKITLNFNDANEMTEIVITVEEINIFNSLLSELNDAIANIELLEEDFEEFKEDYDELKQDFENLNSDFSILNQNYQTVIREVENINIDVSKNETVATVTITNKNGVEKSVEIFDGDDYVLTEEDKQEIINTVETEVSLNIPTKVSQLENDSAYINKEVNNLTNYYKKDETYTKQEVDNKVSSVYKYKGSVATYADLPSSDLTIGDVYNVEADGSNYAWNGSNWDKLGGEIDLSDYYTKSQTDTLLNAKQNTIDSSHKLNAGLVDDTNSTNKFTNATEKSGWNAKYDKPSGGIPKTDLDSSVQTSLGKADTALQEHQDISGKEDESNKSNELDDSTINYPTTHAVKTVTDNLEAVNNQQNALLNALYQIAPKTDYEEGTEVTLEDCIAYKLEYEDDIVGYGEASQDTTTGKQLIKFSNETNNNVVLTNNDNGTLTLDGSNTADCTFYKNITLPAGTYYINYIYVGGNITSEATTYFQLLAFSGNTQLAGIFANSTNYQTNSNTSFSLSAETTIQIRIYIGATARNFNKFNFGFMLTKDNYSYDVEPYTGGYSSPSPNWEQPISCVTGNIEELVRRK